MILVRSRAYYRHQRSRAINKKMKRVKLGFWYVKPGHEGSLSKGKTHCACGMCSTKTKKDGWHKNYLAKFESMKDAIEDYFNETE